MKQKNKLIAGLNTPLQSADTSDKLHNILVLIKRGKEYIPMLQRRDQQVLYWKRRAKEHRLSKKDKYKIHAYNQIINAYNF